MSNRTRLTPPAEVIAFARAYRCTDCTGRAGKPRRRDGAWHVDVAHDDGCPLLTGKVDRTTAACAAAQAAAAETTKRVVYVGIFE